MWNVKLDDKLCNEKVEWRIDRQQNREQGKQWCFMTVWKWQTTQTMGLLYKKSTPTVQSVVVNYDFALQELLSPQSVTHSNSNSW
jgi:hypothetical protein